MVRHGCSKHNSGICANNKILRLVASLSHLRDNSKAFPTKCHAGIVLEVCRWRHIDGLVRHPPTYWEHVTVLLGTRTSCLPKQQPEHINECKL